MDGVEGNNMGGLDRRGYGTEDISLSGGDNLRHDLIMGDQPIGGKHGLLGWRGWWDTVTV